MRPIHLLAAAVAAVAAPSAAVWGLPPAAQVAADQRESSIEWTIAGERGQSDKVQLTIESRWGPNSNSVWSNDRSLSELAGLGPTQLSGARGPVRFALVKEAGRLDCAGTAGSLRGGGSCSFTPDAGFASYLQARGMGVPTRHQAFSLTMSGVGRDLVDALDKGGFERPRVEQLTAMGIHGATADYVRALSGLGYRLSADDVVAFKIHGVDPDYIRALAPIAPKLRHISASDLVSLKIHGVEPQFVRAMAAMGPQFQEVTADDLVNMAIHGVTADYVEQIAALGYRNLSADDFVNMAIHGVTPDYVRSLRRSGMAPASAQQLVKLRLSGFDPEVR
jgi:hypothetical protein